MYQIPFCVCWIGVSVLLSRRLPFCVLPPTNSLMCRLYCFANHANFIILDNLALPDLVVFDCPSGPCFATGKKKRTAPCCGLMTSAVNSQAAENQRLPPKEDFPVARRPRTDNQAPRCPSGDGHPIRGEAAAQCRGPYFPPP